MVKYDGVCAAAGMGASASNRATTTQVNNRALTIFRMGISSRLLFGSRFPNVALDHEGFENRLDLHGVDLRGVADLRDGTRPGVVQMVQDAELDARLVIFLGLLAAQRGQGHDGARSPFAVAVAP